jgi:hypothetical protein
MSYFVVLEYTTGGFKGVRFIYEYKDKEEYDRMSPQLKDGRYLIINEGFSESEACDYVSLTPEVCYLTAAIEESSDPNGHIDEKQLDKELIKAQFLISLYRTYRLPRGIVAPVGPVSFASIKDDGSERSFLLEFVEESFNFCPTNSLGNLDDIVDKIKTSLNELRSPA